MISCTFSTKYNNIKGVTMTWEIILVLLIIVSVFDMALIKIVVKKIPKKSIGLGVFYQYLFCAIIATTYFLFSGNSLTPQVFLPIAIGAAVGLGCYFQWRAVEFSLSKSMVFFPLMQGIPIILAIILLGEGKLWNFQLVLGAGLCFLAAWLFSTKEALNKKWLFPLVAMVVILGIAEFLVKLFSSLNIPVEIFLLGWYNGAFLISIVIIILGRQNPVKIPRKAILLIIPLSFAILGALFLLYWIYQLGGPISLVIPLRWLSITLISILAGWFVFKERKGLSKREWLGFLIGVVGAILILSELFLFYQKLG